MTYTTHRDTQDTLQVLDRADIDASDCSDSELYKRFGLEEQFDGNELTYWQRFRPKVWAVFEIPKSTMLSKVSEKN